MNKSKLSRWCAGAMAAMIMFSSSSVALADTLWVNNNNCKVDAYSMYSNLSNYHLYGYYAGIYLEYSFMYRTYAKQYRQPIYNQIADIYWMYHQIYNNYSLYFLMNYFYANNYFYMCEYWSNRKPGVGVW